MNKKKIGICLSGGVKFPEKSLRSVQALSEKYDIKVFGHTWKINNSETFQNNSWSGIKSTTEKPSDSLSKIISECNFETLIIDNFDNKKNVLEELRKSIAFCISDRTDVGPLSMFYSMCQSNKLKMQYEKESNSIFDIVIRMRYDSEIVDINQFDFETEPDVLYIPEGHNWNGVNDQFAYGNSNVMNIYASLILNLHQHFSGILYNPEAMLKHYLSIAKVNIQRPKMVVKINNN